MQINDLKKILLENNHTIVIYKNDASVFVSNDRGVAPLMKLLKDNKLQLKDSIIADKVIGKAAALLMAYARVKEVYSPMISKPAIKVFEKPTFPSLDLANYLKDSDYEEVELCGLVSNICVISNAVMVKSALPNTNIFIDAKATDSLDKVLQDKCFDVLEGLHIKVINR